MMGNIQRWLVTILAMLAWAVVAVALIPHPWSYAVSLIGCFVIGRAIAPED